MLGSNVCRELLNQGYSVRAMILKGESYCTIDGLGIEIKEGDILNYELLKELMLGCNCVIHIAAITDIFPRRSDFLKKVNYEGTVNVVKAVKELKIERMIHIGSASSFGKGDLEKPGNENSPYKGENYKMDYLDSKYQTQQMLLNEYKENNFPVVIINPTYMIGEYDSKPSSGKLIVSICNRKLKYFNEGGRNFVYSKDVAVAVVNAIKMGKKGECYLAGNENISFYEFFKKIYKILDRPFDMIKISNLPVLIVGFLGSLWARISKKKPEISLGIALISIEKSYYNPSKAQKELLMPSTPIDKAISNSIEWFRSHNYIK